MRVMLSQSMYFPWAGFFSQMSMCDVYISFDGVFFSKGSFVNRVQIQLPKRNDFNWLTIPLHKITSKKLISQISPDHSKDWKRDHLNLLSSAFTNAPHFTDVMKIFNEAVFQIDPRSSLGQISFSTIRHLSSYLGLTDNLLWFSGDNMHENLSNQERVLAILKDFGATSYLSGLGGKNYLDPNEFSKAGIKLEYMDYRIGMYPQLFKPFNPRLTILDMIANVGKNANDYFLSKIEEVN